jgi:hypothetical protein
MPNCSAPCNDFIPTAYVISRTWGRTWHITYNQDMGREMMARIWEEKDKVLSPAQLTRETDLFIACSRSLGPHMSMEGSSKSGYTVVSG